MKRTSKLTRYILTLLVCSTPFTIPAIVQGDTWETKAPMTAPRLAATVGVINGRLYIAGGHDGGGNHGGLSAYDPATNSWETKAAPPIPVTWAAGGVIGGKFYVVAGCIIGCGDVTNQLQVYDPPTDTWSNAAPIPTPRSTLAAAVIADKLYVVGGIKADGSTQPNSLDVYDPATDTWTTNAPIPTPREGANAAAIDGKLYVLGGFVRGSNVLINIMEVYDPPSNTWTTKAPMPTSRLDFGVGVIDGKLHVVGGYSCCACIATHEVYDPVSDAWTTKSPMTTARGALVAGVINSMLYAAGGQLGTGPITGALEVYSNTGSQTCVPLPSGSVSWWDGDSVSGTTASDISDGNNGTMLGGVSISPGMVGNAFNFDGATGRISMGNPASLNFGTTGPFSLEAWFKWDGGGSFVNNIIRKTNYPVSGPGAGYWLRIGKASQTMEFFAGETTGASGFARGNVTIDNVTPGSWHHVVGTRESSGTMSLYLDGELKGTTQVPNADTTSDAPLVLGAWDDRFGVIELFSGLLDEISVYNRALNASEVQAIFIAGNMGKCKGNENSPPVALCRDETVSAGQDCTAAASIDNGSFDPDQGDTITVNQSPAGPYPLGTTPVTLTVTDNHGASSSCSASVTVNDTTPPTIACPANIVVNNSNSPGQCSAVVNYSVMATDNCSGVTAACSPPSGSVFAKGTTGVTCTTTDSSGNTSSCSFTVTVIPSQLTALSPALVWLGLKNSDDVGTKFDMLAEVFRNGTLVGSGQLDNVPGGSSGFNNAVLRTINLALFAPVDICPGDALSFKLSVRIAPTSGHRAGTARLWFNDSAANSRFGATVGGAMQSYYLRNGFLLSLAPGPGPKSTIDVTVDRAVGGNPFKAFGTWSITF